MYLVKTNKGHLKFQTDSNSDDSKYVFYIINKGKKILTRYEDKGFITILSDIIRSKKVTIQCYYTLNGEKIKEQIDDIVYSDIKFTRGYLTNDYQAIIENGYQSFDKKLKININKIDWKYTKDNNFNFNVHSLRFLSSFWGEYSLTYDYGYIQKALEIFKDFWEQINEKKLNKFKNYDMALGIRALHIYFLSNFKEHFSKTELEFFDEIYEFHFNELRYHIPITLNNHGIWQIYGLRMLVFANNDININDINYCTEEFKKLLDFSFNEEGIHVENSPFYHNYVVSLFNVLPKELFAQVQKFRSIVMSKDQIVSWLCDNNKKYYQIGDSHGEFSKNLSIYRSKLKPDTVIKNINFYSKSFKKTGYFIARNINESRFDSFVFNCTNDTPVHKHADNLSFILWHNNIEIITDSGPFAYEYSANRDYFVSDKAHNVLSLKNKILSVKDIILKESKILSTEVEEGFYRAVGVSSYNNFSFEREIKYYPLSKVIIKDTVLKNIDKDNVTFNLTFGLDVEVINIDNTIYLKYLGTNVAKIISKTPYVECNIFNGSKIPMRGWVSKKYNTMNKTNALEMVYQSSVKNISIEIELL